MSIERAVDATLLPAGRASVGLSKFADGKRTIAISFHTSTGKIELVPLSVLEAVRFSEALVRAVDIMRSN